MIVIIAIVIPVVEVRELIVIVIIVIVIPVVEVRELIVIVIIVIVTSSRSERTNRDSNYCNSNTSSRS